MINEKYDIDLNKLNVETDEIEKDSEKK